MGEPPKTLTRQHFDLASFRQRSNGRAAWQLLVTLVPVALLWAVIPHLMATAALQWLMLPVLALLVLFSARTFSLMHDCGHNSLWSSSWLNRVTGFLLGCLNAVPQYPWSRGHAYHHKHNGNWDLYRGPSSLLSVDQFLQLPPGAQRRYAIIRHPLMLFPGGFFYLVVRPRLQLLLGLVELASAVIAELWRRPLNGWTAWRAFFHGYQSSHWYTWGEFLDLLLNNLVVLSSWWWMVHWLGAGLFWVCYSLVMSCSAAIFICVFFVQHNFQGSYANGSDGWSYFKGAIEGSSNLVLHPILNWFSADIAYHSVHHLCERIPNYRLRDCHRAHAHLLTHCTYLSLSDIPRCFDLILWDSVGLRLLSIREALDRTPQVQHP